MNFRPLLLISGFAVSLSALAPQVQAVDGEWTAVASTCVPDENSDGEYEFDFGRARFRGANTGVISFRCNVTDPADFSNPANPSWARMDVTYDDPDGFFSDHQVQVTLRRVHEVSGNSFLLATFDSDSFPPGQQLQAASFNHLFNFRDNAYYVGISLRRPANATMNPTIQRIRLYLPPVG